MARIGRREMSASLRRVVGPERSAAFKRGVGMLVSPSLHLLAVLYGTDKGPRRHNYTLVYRMHFHDRRWRTRSLLEIGIGGYDSPARGGKSLRVWRHYFPRAEIIGIDIHPKHVSERRVTTEICDQSDEDALRSLAARHGPFDIIIDDGSHIGPHVNTTFRVLFPAVSDGGIYVIEDTHTSYEPDPYLGGAPGTPGTAVSLIKALIDDLHLGRDVGRIDVHQGVTLIYKGESLSQATDLWEQVDGPSWATSIPSTAT